MIGSATEGTAASGRFRNTMTARAISSRIPVSVARKGEGGEHGDGDYPELGGSRKGRGGCAIPCLLRNE